MTTRFEPMTRRPLPTPKFILRMLRHTAAAGGVVVVSIVGGMIGYEHFECLPWRDAMLNTCMLLGGMGPVNPPVTPGGKLFASFYALYAGLVFLLVAGVIMVPVVHRVLHHLHWDPDAPEAQKEEGRATRARPSGSNRKTGPG